MLVSCFQSCWSLVLKHAGVLFSGMLGKTITEVELLRFRSPRDPCDALLQDWASRDPDATVRDLVNIMHDMQRLDVVTTIEDFPL